MDGYLRAWRELHSRLSQSVDKHRADPTHDIILSTSIFWVMPLMATSYNDIFVFVRQFCSSSEVVGVEPKEL